MIFCFPKSIRLRSRRQYQRIAQQPTRYVGNLIIIEARQSKFPQTKLGITASRHYGKAVQRNRFKRIVREAFRTGRHDLQQGLDINIKPRHSALNASAGDILAEFHRFLAVKP